MNKIKEHQLGILYAFLSATIYSLYNISIRYSEPYLTVWHILFFRSLIGVTAMSVFARWMDFDMLGQRRGLLIITGLAGMGSLICILEAIILLPLFEALVLIYLYPVFAALLSPRLTGEKMTPSEWLLIGLAFCGTTLILWSGHVGGQFQPGHLFALIAAFANALTVTLIRLLSAKNNSLTPLFYVSVVGCLVCAGPLLLQDAPLQVGAKGVIWILVIATLATSAYLAAIKALAYLPSPKMGVISMTEVALGAFSGFVLFNESLSWRSFFGAVLIIGSGIRLNLKSGKGKGIP